MSKRTELSEARRALLEKYLRGDGAQTTVTNTIPLRAPGNTLPLSFGQQQLWLLAQLVADIPAYNESVTVRLPGPLDVAALEQSFNELIQRHEAWRTSFLLVDGKPAQVIHPSLTFKLPVVDLQRLQAVEREAEALRLATEEALLPFDLTQVPLLRATLVRLNDTDHRLFVTLHHIIFDGFTVYQVFLPELRALYEAYTSEQPSSLPPLPIQYGDYSVWQRNWLQGEKLTAQLAYWKQQLTGAPTTLELPIDHPRPAVPTYRGSIQSFTLSRNLTGELKAFCQQEGYTLYVSLLAAFSILLYRYTSQEDILIGTATAGRSQTELQKLMGVFINTLVMRTDLRGNPSVRELLARLREMTIDAQTYQDVPFEYLVKELHPNREMGQNPFFQVLLILEPPVPTLPSGWTLAPLEVNTETAKFDLSLILEDRPEGLRGWFEYSTDLFSATTIERMVGHWQTLLEGIVSDPNQRIGELPLLTEAERQMLLVEWNDTATDYPKNQCLQQLFEVQVERTPNAVALAFQDERLTYRELNSKANQLAHHLQQLGVGPEVLVGISVERSLEMVVGLLGILKAGGVYVPLDPAYPQDRLAFMLQDAQVSVLLTQQRLVENLPEHTARMICLDTDWKTIAQQSDKNLVSGVASEHLAYVLYTSGSTGRPKGVAIEHRSAVAFSQWAMSIFTPEDLAGVLASTSICFDLSVFEIFVPLSSGGAVIMTENVLHLPGLSASKQVTLINTVPSAMAELVRNGSLPPSVCTVNLAGELLPHSLAQRIYQQDTIRRVFNLYGPTEATTYSTYALLEKGEREPTIGYPIANTQVYILDSHLQVVPIGVVGELYIGGDGLARGYLNRPELTAERFISHPFSQNSGARLYKTGDLARYLPDGSIEFLGRSDHQVKLRGFRIELGEIEEVLRRHPQVQEAVVMAREDILGDKRLAAYVVAAQGQAPSVKNLQSFLQEKLPGYMVPSAFMLLDALPLTPNGKVDRCALPIPEPASRTAEDTYVAPTMTVHYQLIQIWEELLNTRPIGMRDNFFHLGGHSFLAIRLVDRIEQVFAKKISLSVLFANPTIEQLASALRQQEHTSSRSPVVAVQSGGSKRPFFFLHGDYKGGPFFCFPLARDLGSDQPFYALEPYRFDDLPIPPTLEAMAATHIELLRTVQPEGPYLLGGFCGGGLEAYEVARQLHAQGQRVDLLVLMDPTPVGYFKSLRTVVNRFGGMVRLGQEKRLACFLWLRHLYRYLQHLYRYLLYPRYRRLKTELDPEWVNLNGGTILALKALHELRLVYGAGYLENDEQLEHRYSNMSFALPRLDAIFPDPLFPTVEALRHDWEGIFHWSASVYVLGFYPGKSTFFFFRTVVGTVVE